MRSNSPFRRPCLDCGIVTEPNKSRCKSCASGKEKKRKAMRGATPIANAIRQELKAVGDWACAQCHMRYPHTYLCVDHIIPLWDRGTDTTHNIQVLCDECHKEKTAAEATARAKRGNQ